MTTVTPGLIRVDDGWETHGLCVYGGWFNPGPGRKASDIDGTCPCRFRMIWVSPGQFIRLPFRLLVPAGKNASFLRLASGRLFAAADYLNSEGEGVPECRPIGLGRFV